MIHDIAFFAGGFIAGVLVMVFWAAWAFRKP